MPPTDGEVIDLTLSEDEGDNQPDSRPKRTRYNDDDDVIIVEGDVPVPKPIEPEAANDIGDDEVMLVSTNGGEDWTSLPHTRDLCRQCPFKLGMHASNAKYCARCFCYICDCPASQCKDWGTGTARAHHCNATAKGPTYRTQRQEHLKENRAARNQAPAGGTSAAAAAAVAAPARPTSGGANTANRSAPLPFYVGNTRPAPSQSAGTTPSPSSDDEDSNQCDCPNCRRRRYPTYDEDDIDRYDEYGNYEYEYLSTLERTEAQRNAARAQASKKCTMKELPDPLLDPTMIELAQLSFEVEAIGDNKISDIAKRLVPHGFYEAPVRLTSGSSYQAGEKLNLRRLVSESYSNGYAQQPVITMSPVTLTPAPTEPSPTRVVPILVQFWDGRAVPKLYGVTITPGSTVEELVEKLREMMELEPTIDINLYCGDQYPRFFARYKLDDQITDEWLVGRNFDTPEAKLSAYCLPKKDPSRPSRPMAGTRDPPSMLIRNRSFIAALVTINWENAATDMYGNDTGPKLMKIMVPLGHNNDATGGRAVSAYIAGKVIDALRPYRLNPDHVDETRCLAASIKIAWGARSQHNLLDDAKDYATVCHGYSYSFAYKSTQITKSDAVVLSAHFSIADLEAFNTELWKNPIVEDASAAPAALKPTREYIKKVKAVGEANDEEKRLPKRVLFELEDASLMRNPDSPPPTAATVSLGTGPDALVRYKAELIPFVEPSTSKGKRKKPDDKKGTLKIRVFVFRTAGVNRIGFFDQGSEWGAASARQGRNRASRNIVPHKLMFTLWCHLQQNPKFVALEEHRKHWAAKDRELASRRSITALMEAMERPEAPAAVQPGGLTVTLRPYQLQSLQFMKDAESGEGGFRQHLWVPATAVDGTPFFYSPLLGRVASSVADQPYGGFCCEEMGLGKTVEVLALCLANPAPPLPAPGTTLPNKKLHSRATLVVCAVSLVGQWIAEAQEKTGGSLKIHMYHGPGRIKNAHRLATEFDLVVTTYATLSADCGRQNNPKASKAAGNNKKDAFTTSNSPLHGVEWHRLVLDESHTCKNPAVGHTKACVALEAKRRWMCTGTPINTDVLDLYGQFAVLGFAPFNNRNFFDANVRNAFGNNVYGGGCPELLHALGAIMVRHTKRQELGGEQVLQLPPKTEELVPVILTAREQAVYKRVHATAAEYFSRYERMGPQYASKNLLHIMSLLLPMRRICSGGALAERDLTVSEPIISAAEAQEVADARNFVNSGAGNNSAAVAELKVDESLVAPDGEECPICMDAYEEPAVTTCNHWYCKACIINVLQSMHARCPLCRGPQRVNQLRCGITAGDAAERNAAENYVDAAALVASQTAADVAAAERLAEREAAIVSTADGLISESKLAALLKSLRAMRRADPTAKALIFSQYNSTIEWLKGRLTREGFGHRHISGSMPLKQRAQAIQAFQGDPPTTVFLLSMRSGAVGINLTAASHVFLLEPALNPALEDQAVGRAWRMGQRREVKVVRFYVKGSVEEQIMEVVKTRQTGVAGAAAANANGASGSNDPQYRPHIRVEDQAGSIKEDKQNLRLNELQALFKLPEFPEPRSEEALSEEEDEPMSDARQCNHTIDYGAMYNRNNRMQQQQAMDENEAGTSAMHAAMGNGNNSKPGAGVPAGVMKNRMRRSKAGIASVAGGVGVGVGVGAAAAVAAAAATAAGVAATPQGAVANNNNNTTTGAGGAGPSNANGTDAAPTTAANGVTPAATLPAGAATAAAAGAAAPEQQQEEKEEEVVEMAPAAILQRIKLLAQRATGRLTPANQNGAVGSQRAASTAAKAANAELAEQLDTDDEDLDEDALDKLLAEDSPGPKAKKGRGPSRTAADANKNGNAGQEVEAITAHIPNPTPDTDVGANGRVSRRAVRPNYAMLANQGVADEDGGAAAATTTAVQENELEKNPSLALLCSLRKM